MGGLEGSLCAWTWVLLRAKLLNIVPASPEQLGKEDASPEYLVKRMFLVFLRGREQRQGWGKQREGRQENICIF